jgi:hypothetical protein
MISVPFITSLIHCIGNQDSVLNCYCKNQLNNTISLHSILKFAGQNFKYCQRIPNVWVKKGNYLPLNSSLS